MAKKTTKPKATKPKATKPKATKPPQDISGSLGISREEFKSNRIKTMGYSADKKLLEVEFLNGNVFVFSNFPKNEYDLLLKDKYDNKSIDDSFKKFIKKYISIILQMLILKQ